MSKTFDCIMPYCIKSSKISVDSGNLGCETVSLGVRLPSFRRTVIISNDKLSEITLRQLALEDVKCHGVSKSREPLNPKLRRHIP
jgi:hypothetical protein